MENVKECATKESAQKNTGIKPQPKPVKGRTAKPKAHKDGIERAAKKKAEKVAQEATGTTRKRKKKAEPAKKQKDAPETKGSAKEATEEEKDIPESETQEKTDTQEEAGADAGTSTQAGETTSEDVSGEATEKAEPVTEAQEERKQRRGRPRKKATETSSPKLKIIPLGGLEEIGINMTAFEYKDSVIVVDCGIAFPDDNMLGVDLLIPDTDYLERNKKRIQGLFITHGHEDHIGAIPFVLKNVSMKLYATKLTVGIIENKLEQHHMLAETDISVVNFGDTIKAGDFSIEFIKTNHSIQDSAALAIHSPVGTVIHTGDFKVDYTPVYGDPIDLAKFAELGQRGVLALLCDSTNAEKHGFTMSEKSVGLVLDDLFEKYKDKRILIATFASNVDRVQQIINSAHKTGRKVAIDGRSMVTIIGIAMRLGYIKMPKNTLVDIDDLKDYKPEETVIIMTGSQGEKMSALPRIARGIHHKISASSNDVVILSSHAIPGNEKAVKEVINAFMMRGIEVVFQDVHVSGHACEEDIKLIYSLTKPKFSVPVHGDYSQRTAQANIARAMGYDEEHIKMLHSGDILEIDGDGAEITGQVQAGKIMVDGNGIGNVGNIVLKERKQLANDGIVIVLIAYSEYNFTLLSDPQIVCRGFVYMKGAQELMGQMYDVVRECIAKFADQKHVKKETVKEEIKLRLGDFLWDEMRAKPMVLPVIMEV